MTRPLPERLHAAYNWIDSAGEWDDALSDPTYPAGAAANWRENAVPGEWDGGVTESDLSEVIEWERLRRSETTAAATVLGARGGAVKSERKAAAARENGKRGGRPRKKT